LIKQNYDDPQGWAIHFSGQKSKGQRAKGIGQGAENKKQYEWWG